MGVRGNKGSEAVLVLQVGNRSGPWACRSLARAGFRVVGAHEGGRVAGRSRYCMSPIRTPSPTASPDLFLEHVERICRDHSVGAVLPGDDEGITQLLATRLPRPANAILVGPDATQYAQACDKSNLHATAKAAGLEAPSAAHVGDGGPDTAWPPLPSIVKPRTTQTQIAGGFVARTAILVTTPAEREAAVAEICAATGGAVVEERVVGRAWRTHFVTDIAHTAAVPVITVRSSPEVAGMSSVQTVAPAIPPELQAASQRLIEFLHYSGPGSFQFIERDGQFFIHDVNLRLPSSVAVTILAGLDMPRLGVEVALGRETALDSVTIRPGVRYVWLNGELRTLVRRIAAREPVPRIWEVAADIVLAAVVPGRVLDQFVLTDPLPTVALVARGLRRSATRLRLASPTAKDAA
jgi:predicted ATP-grasp superfamily ATP-dependent carboligase